MSHLNPHIDVQSRPTHRIWVSQDRISSCAIALSISSTWKDHYRTERHRTQALNAKVVVLVSNERTADPLASMWAKRASRERDHERSPSIGLSWERGTYHPYGRDCRGDRARPLGTSAHRYECRIVAVRCGEGNVYGNRTEGHEVIFPFAVFSETATTWCHRIGS